MGASDRSIRTRDGRTLSVRPITPSDREAFLEAFSHLSDESRYRRFLRPIRRLTEKDVEYFTEVDHRDHEALIAVTGEGEIVGVARYVRLKNDPEKAEVAVTVADDWQGNGVGSALLDLLAAQARDAGIEAFTGICLAGNTDMRQLLEELGPGARTGTVDDGVVEVEVPLPEEAERESPLLALIRAAARGYADWLKDLSARDRS